MSSLRRWLILLVLLLPMLGDSWLHAQLNRRYYYETTQRMMARGEFTASIGNINVLLHFVPEDEIALYLRALGKYNLDDFRGAQEDLNKVLKIRPFFAQALWLRAGTLNQLKEFDAAMADLTLAHELRPEDMQVIFWRGNTHYLRGEWEEAIKDFSTTLQNQPSNMAARLQKGSARIHLGDTIAAIRDFKQAAHSNPYKPDPYISLALAYLSQDSLALALKSIGEALRIDKKNSRAMLVKAIIQHELKQVEEAIATITHVIALSGRNSLALYNRALMYSEKGDWEKAIEDYNQASRISPTNVIIHYNQALALLEQKQLGPADDALTRAIELFPTFAQAYKTRSFVRYQLGQLNAAKQDIESAEALTAKYKADRENGDSWSDTTANFSQYIAFESEFAPSSLSFAPGMSEYSDLQPLASIHVAQQQPLQEWPPVRKANQENGGPFFALTVPNFDSLSKIELDMLPKLQKAYPINLILAISEQEAHNYDRALDILDSIPAHATVFPLAQLSKATTLIDKIRYGDVKTESIPLYGLERKSRLVEGDYAEPIALLKKLNKSAPSAYIDYNLAIAHYLSRDLPSAEAYLNEAIRQEPQFAEALYNRALVRLLQNRPNAACLDLSRAGELGLDQAYRVISQQCNR